MKGPNVDRDVVAGFGDEWTRFDQDGLKDSEADQIFQDYFSQFPWDLITAKSVGADFGCGSGRWAKLVAHRVGRLHCIDASHAALQVAKRNLAASPNCVFHCASVEEAPIAPQSLDFGYSLGVLHHTPDPAEALSACARFLKPGAPFLVYLYYRFDNRPRWFRMIWLCSEFLRSVVSRSPHFVRFVISQVLATFLYWPLARLSQALRAFGKDVSALPLSYYADKSFYVMRTDALDRFGTRLEHRFTRVEITEMMQRAGLERISFSDSAPFWCAVGYRSRQQLA